MPLLVINSPSDTDFIKKPLINAEKQANFRRTLVINSANVTISLEQYNYLMSLHASLNGELN